MILRDRNVRDRKQPDHKERQEDMQRQAVPLLLPGIDGLIAALQRISHAATVAAHTDIQKPPNMAHPKYRGTYLAIRKAWTPVVARGEATCHEPICLMPTRHIAPGTRWDLSHAADGSILGPSHSYCNRSEGGKRGRAAQTNRFLQL